MKYMLLIHADESGWATLSEQEQQAAMGEYFAYTQALTDAGALVGVDRLHPTTATTTVRVRDGEVLTTDGPFAETKEQLGGYFLIDVETLDEALEWAAKCPGAGHGSVEVRPVMTMPVAAS